MFNYLCNALKCIKIYEYKCFVVLQMASYSFTNALQLQEAIEVLASLKKSIKKALFLVAFTTKRFCRVPV